MLLHTYCFYALTSLSTHPPPQPSTVNGAGTLLFPFFFFSLQEIYAAFRNDISLIVNTGKKSQPRQNWGCRRDTLPQNDFVSINVKLLQIHHKNSTKDVLILDMLKISDFQRRTPINYSQSRFWFWDKRDDNREISFPLLEKFC